MSEARQAGSGLSVLTLHIVEAGLGPDRPVVSILVDGADPFRTVAPDWLGFDPAAVLGWDSPLLPTHLGRRVAVKRCSCGEAGCGVIAPAIVASPDGRRVSWVDFRNFVGVFIDPVWDGVVDHEGKPWSLPDLHFDRAQYVAEVSRAMADLSWETPRRRCARLVRERLTAVRATVPPGLELVRVVPSRGTVGFDLSLAFVRDVPDPEYSRDWAELRLRSDAPDADAAASDVVDRLLAESPSDWTTRFGDDRG